MNKENIVTSKLGPDGKFYRKTKEGWVEESSAEPMFGPNFPEGEPEYDPENPPLTDE